MSQAATANRVNDAKAQARALQLKRIRAGTTESPWVRRTLIGIALAFMALFLVLPLAAVFTEALSKGWSAYLEALKEPDAISAIKLTLITAIICVPVATYWPTRTPTSPSVPLRGARISVLARSILASSTAASALATAASREPRLTMIVCRSWRVTSTAAFA